MGGLNLKKGSALGVSISSVFDDAMGSSRLVGMQQVHKNARKWKLFEFLEDVVDPTGIRYAFMRCNLFRGIPSVSKRKRWRKKTVVPLLWTRKTVAANCIAYSNYICGHLGFAGSRWKCTKNAVNTIKTMTKQWWRERKEAKKAKKEAKKAKKEAEKEAKKAKKEAKKAKKEAEKD